MNRFSELACGLLAIALSALAIWSAWDFGGGNFDTHFAAAMTVLALLPVGLLATGTARRGGLAPLLWLTALTCGVVFLQTVPLPQTWTQWLAPGSAEAYDAWLPAPLVAEAAASPSLATLPAAQSRAPISVSVTHTRMAMALPAMFGLTLWLGMLSISRPVWGIVFLTSTAVASGLFGFFGLADSIRLSRDHQVELRQRLIISPVGADKPFGPFVNNNNGAGYTNLGIGCAVALLTLSLNGSLSRPRVASVGTEEQGGSAGHTGRQERSWQPKSPPLADARPSQREGDAGAFADARPSQREGDEGRVSWLGVARFTSWHAIACLLLITLLLAAVLGSESRGGFLGTLAGAMGLGLAMLRGRKRWWGLLAGVAVLLLAVWLLDALGMRQQSSDRLHTLVDEQTLEDPRLAHWSDSLSAAMHYLPLGGGFGAYAFAHLPYQQHGGSGWFYNADGMPVEWLLEGGLWLLPVVLIGVALLVRELIFLAAQRYQLPAPEAAYADALLTGLTFMLPAMLVSQCFDFGILLPPLLLTLAAVCGGALGLAARLRSSQRLATAADTPAAAHASSRRSRLSRSLRLAQAAALLILVASLAGAVRPLQDGAVVQQMRLTREALIRRPATALPDYTADIEQLRDILGRRPEDSEARIMLANLLLDQQRRRGADYLVDQQIATAEQATRMVSPRNVRKAFYQQHPPGSLPIEVLMMPTQDLAAWREARQHALAGLLLRPLDEQPRILLIELDMLLPDANAVTDELLQQSRTLRSRDDRSLQSLQRLEIGNLKPEISQAAP